MNQRTSGPNDPVRDYLRRSGASYAVVAQGLRGLVENWERVVAQVLEGYNLTLDDYLNDMDSRQLLANALELAPDEVRDAFLPRVHDADVKVRLNLVPAGGDADDIDAPTVDPGLGVEFGNDPADEGDVVDPADGVEPAPVGRPPVVPGAADTLRIDDDEPLARRNLVPGEVAARLLRRAVRPVQYDDERCRASP